MSWQKLPPSTFEHLAQDADRRLVRVKAGGAAFGALLAITFGDLSTHLVMHAPSILLAFFATIFSLSGFELARTYAAFHNCRDTLAGLATTDLSRPVPERQEVKSQVRAARDDGRQPDRFTYAADEYYFGRIYHYPLALTLTFTAMALFLAAVWVSAVS